jgi:ribose transport system permease protein
MGEVLIHTNSEVTSTAREDSLSARSTSASHLRSLSLLLSLLRLGPLLILIVMITSASALSPYFLTPRNISNVLAQTVVIATLALGQYVVILTRGIDLSVGSNIALCSVIGALVYHTLPGLDGTSISILAIFTMLATGGLVGLINGAVFVYGRLPHPFIITLATLSICKGLAFELSQWQTISGVAPAVQFIGRQLIFGLPFSVLVVAAISLFLWYGRGLVWGRWIYAVGGNPDAAVRAGIPSKKVLVSVYVISGICAAIGAVIIAGRTNSGSGLLGDLGELDSIAAVIIGGASFVGGRGNVGQALVGALMIGVMRNALNLLNVSIFFQLIVIGIVIVLAVESDVLRAHLENRFRVLQAASTS